MLFVSLDSASQMSAMPPRPGPRTIAGRIIHGLTPAIASAVKKDAATSEPPSHIIQRRSSLAATAASTVETVNTPSSYRDEPAQPQTEHQTADLTPNPSAGHRISGLPSARTSGESLIRRLRR